MAEVAVLSVELQARVDAFVASLLQAANATDQTGAATTQMSTSISRNIANVNRLNLSQFTTALNAGTLSVNQLGAAAARVPSTVRPLIVGSNQAAFALTNLGRVAQDAPFGFIGIQNNLNPLLESFQRLRAETGSNGAALRALGQSLIGPAGLGIAVSVITSAITFYTMYQQKANKATKEAKKSVDDYVDSLTGANRAQLEGAKNSQKDLTNLNLLYNASRNITLSVEARKSAYSELQQLYPDYFKNINFEQVQSEKTRLSYEKLAIAIVATGRARAAANLIAKDSEITLQNEQKIADATYSRNLNEIAQRKELAAFDKQTIRLGLYNSEARVSERQAINNKYLQANSELQQYIGKRIDENNIRNARSVKLVELVNKNLEKGAELTGGGIGKTPTVKVPKIKPERIDLELPDNPEDLIRKFFDKISGINAPGTLTVKAPDKLKIDGTIKPIDLGELFKFDSGSLDKAIANLKLQDKLNDIVINAEQSILKLTDLPGLVGLTADALGQSFEAMGAAIAEGGNVLVAAGAVLQKTFADLLSALGKQFITMGAAKVAAGILASPFGGKLIADGAGLIALGAGLSLGGGLVGSAGKGKTTGSVTAFANGGIISGPTLGLMGEYAGAKSDPEVVAPLSKLKNMLGETDSNGNVINGRGDFTLEVSQSIGLDYNQLVAKLDKVRVVRNRQG